MVKDAVIELDAHEVAEQLVAAARDAHNEQELMMNAAPTLIRVLGKLGIAKYDVHYEFRNGRGTLVEGGEGIIDALYGRVVVEYERPGTFEHSAGFNHAKNR
jgi:hypothetical protein